MPEARKARYPHICRTQPSQRPTFGLNAALHNDTAGSGVATETQASGGTVLVVEDDAVMRQLTTDVLEVERYEVRSCGSLDEARETVRRALPDVITLDLQLRDGSGMDWLRELRADASTAAVPVVVVTGSGTHSIATALAAGAQDFIRKPFEPVELQARVAAALRARRMHDDLIRLATHDVLTGLLNRRGLLAALEAQLAHRSRSGEELTVAMFDVVDFKGVNDTFGHSKGDDVLHDIGVTMSKSLRGSDLLGRLGGDEFLAILPATDEREAGRLIDRLTHDVATRVTLSGRLVEVRAGVVGAMYECTEAEDLLQAVSARLHGGRSPRDGGAASTDRVDLR
jgi:diguanylate cyclase (GGDEF)-like protein